MSRRVLALIATVMLLVLTATTWALADGGAAPVLVAGTAALKVSLVGLVFLELHRSHPGWLLLAMVVVGGILGGSAWLIRG